MNKRAYEMLEKLRKFPLSALSIVLTVSIGILTNIATDTNIKEQKPLIWAILLIITLFAIWIEIHGKRKKVKKDDLLILKKRLPILIEPKYKSQLPETWLNLAFQSANRLIKPPRALEIEKVPERDVTNIPIEEIFNERGGRLLILGEPGAGKTTLLFELAIKLMDRAKLNPDEPIPLVFNLSGWALRPSNVSFSDWLISEMQVSYGIGKDFGKDLICKMQVTFLLDGLDEVTDSRYEDCIQAINDFKKKNVSPVVVCSRLGEYSKANLKLELNGAVVVKRVSKKQALLWFQAHNLPRLMSAYQSNPSLQDALGTPLMLVVAKDAFSSSGFSVVAKSEVENVKNWLWKAFLIRAFGNKKEVEDKKQKYSPSREKVWHWTKWLALIMKERDLTVLYLERMQPDLLSRPRFVAYRIINNLIGGLLLGLPGGCLLALIGKSSSGLAVISGGLILGLALGLGVVLEALITKFMAPLKAQSIAIGLAFGLAAGITLELTVGIAVGLTFGLAYWLGGGTPFIKIIPVEVIKWSWKWSNGLLGLVYGLLFGAALGLAIGVAIGLKTGLTIGLTFGLAFGITGGLNRNLSTYTMKNEYLEKPNEGIQRSKRFAILSIIPGLLLLFAVWFFRDELSFSISKNLDGVVVASIAATIFAWLIPIEKGGNAVMSHYVLRFLLYSGGYSPLKYISFLDYVSRLGLLRKVGGGYRFYHRELRDFIVDSGEIPDKPA